MRCSTRCIEPDVARSRRPAPEFRSWQEVISGRQRFPVAVAPSTATLWPRRRLRHHPFRRSPPAALHRALVLGPGSDSTPVTQIDGQVSVLLDEPHLGNGHASRSSTRTASGRSPVTVADGPALTVGPLVRRPEPQPVRLFVAHLQSPVTVTYVGGPTVLRKNAAGIPLEFGVMSLSGSPTPQGKGNCSSTDGGN